MTQIRQRKPLRTLVRVVGNDKIYTLEKPFVIHYPGRNKNVSSRHARKTFALNFFNNTVLITVARCSKKDQFCRRIGNNVATGRLKMLTEDYLSNNGYSDIPLSQPFCRMTKIEDIWNRPSVVFKECTIPEDVVLYIKEIYSRFTKQTGIQDIPF